MVYMETVNPRRIDEALEDTIKNIDLFFKNQLGSTVLLTTTPPTCPGSVTNVIIRKPQAVVWAILNNEYSYKAYIEDTNKNIDMLFKNHPTSTRLQY